jgi:hypothetical protein
MATVMKRAMATEARGMVESTKRVRVRVARGLATATRVADDKGGNGNSS